MNVMKSPESRPLTNYLRLLFLLALYYLSYRYPFQINASTTSPTYTDTPFSLQVLKYVLLGAIVGCYSLYVMVARGMSAFGLAQWVGLLVIGGLVSMWALVSAVSGDLSHLESGIFWLAAVPIIFCPERYTIRLETIQRILRWFVYLTSLAFVVQVGLFVTVGRFPALAYADSLFVRFGGIWDDPNGFSIFLSFIIPFVYFSRMKYRRLLLAISLVSLLASQSFTGILAFAGSVVLGGFCLFMTPIRRTQALRLSRFYLWASFTGLMSLGLVFYLALAINIDVIGTALAYIELKQGSVEGHKQSFTALKDASALTWIGLDPQGFRGESGYATHLMSIGVGFTLAYIIVLLGIFWKALQVLKEYHDKPGVEIFYGIVFFLGAFILGMVNLPLDNVFPVNLLFVLFAIIVFQAQRISPYRTASLLYAGTSNPPAGRRSRNTKNKWSLFLFLQIEAWR